MIEAGSLRDACGEMGALRPKKSAHYTRRETTFFQPDRAFCRVFLQMCCVHAPRALRVTRTVRRASRAPRHETRRQQGIGATRSRYRTTRTPRAALNATRRR
jgi:hypothetical protein